MERSKYTTTRYTPTHAKVHTMTKNQSFPLNKDKDYKLLLKVLPALEILQYFLIGQLLVYKLESGIL